MIPVTNSDQSPGSPKLKLGFDEIGIAYSCLIVLVAGALLWTVSGSKCEQTDFATVYVGARIVHLGQSARLYDLQEQAAVRKSIFKTPTTLPFVHPPFEALIFSPLAALPYRAVYILWSIINAVIWLSLPFLLRPYAPAPRETLGYLALWAFFAPLGMALFQGQSSLLILLLLTLSFVQLKRGRALAAGLWLGLGLFKFQFVLPFALIFLLRKQWRFLAGFTLSAAFLGTLSLIAVGWRGILSYGRFLTTIAADPHNIAYGAAVYMASLQGFLNVVLGNHLSGTVVGALAAVASLGLIGLTAWQWRRTADAGGLPQATELMFAAAIPVSLAAGSHVCPHDLSVLAISLFLVAAHFPAPQHPVLRFFLGTALVLFWTPVFLLALLVAQGLYLVFPLLMLLAFGAVKLASDLKNAAADAPVQFVRPIGPQRITP